MSNITIPMSLIDSDPNIQQLAVSAVIKGARPTYGGGNVIYPIDDEYLDPASANYIVSVGGTVADYAIVRFIAVNDLAEELPATLPASTIEDEDEDGNTRPRTWQNVQDLPNVNISPVDGVYYFDATAHLGHRGLTLDEHNAATGIDFILTPPQPEPTEI